MLALHSTTRPKAIALPPVSIAWAHKAQTMFAKWRRRRKAIADLHALSDRSLADIGIDRSEIEAVVRARGRDASRRTR